MERIFEDPRLLPLLPLLYIAWSDGELSDSEIETVRAWSSEHPALEPEMRAVLSSWLDPEKPPTATLLLRALRHIRRSMDKTSECERMSLAELGLSLGKQAPQTAEYWAREENRRALAELVEALGLTGREGTREILQLPPPPHTFGFGEEPEPDFPVMAMTALLDGPDAETKNKVRAFLVDPAFAQHPESTKEEARERVLRWVRLLAASGLTETAYPGVTGSEPHLGAFIAVFETLGFFDPSLAVKFGVQFGLFGGSIYFLGTEPHHRKYLTDIAAARLLGCFAMTELGHGSNVRDLQTVASYDRGTREWEIHTPHESARKEWIGGAALHARMATVFAQLEIDGEHHGVHAFLVPIRDDQGRVLPGIRIEDCGHKMGLNGVDNGSIRFDRVRVPRENLLDRFAQVSPEGDYRSDIPGAGKRFFTMLSTLVGGRVSIACAAVSVAKTGLAIAIRYGVIRRQFGPAGQPEVPILNYQVHQRRLLPKLAETYALCFANHELVARFIDHDEDGRRELEATAAALKAIGTRHCTETLQICRECCGGEGYRSANRLGGLKADSDVFTTFEGDNNVLLQLVAKSLLTEYRKQFADMSLLGVLRYLAKQTGDALGELNFLPGWLSDSDRLKNHDVLITAFRSRETHLLQTVARRLQKHLRSGADPFHAFNRCQYHLVSLAEAHGERLVLESFIRAVEAVSISALKRQLEDLCSLYGLSRLEADAGWFLEHGILDGHKARAVRKLITSLCEEIRLQALHLVNAFGIPDQILAAPIAFPGS